MESTIPIEELPILNLNSTNIFIDDNNEIIPQKGSIADCYVCIRPGNKSTVMRIFPEKISENKYITTNYGHGGIGWTTLWGSALKSIQYLLKLLEANEISKKKCVILGAGAVGCATAILLIEEFNVPAENISFIANNINDTTSHRSGAFLSAASVLTEVKSLKDMYDEINVDSFLYWRSINEGLKFNFLKEGVLKIKGYFGDEEEFGTIKTESGLDIFVEKGIISEPEIVYLKFNNQLNRMKKYDTYYFNTAILMHCFYEYLQNKGININIKTITDINEVEGEAIFDCLGLENSKLRQDENIIPIAGHIITLKNQELIRNGKMNFVLYSHYIERSSNKKYNFSEAPLFYYMPKVDIYNNSYEGLLGGSLINNYSGGDSEIEKDEFRGVLRRTLEIFGENNDFLK